MKIFEVKPLVIPEVKLISYQRFSDQRGFFTETFRESDLIQTLPNFKVKQVNESFSQKGVFRGLHFQWNPYMAKLVRVINGRIIDFFLDIRLNSPTFGKISGFELNGNLHDDKNTWIFIPIGFAHGFLALEETNIEYLCNGEYSPTCEAGINPLATDLDWSICDSNAKQKLEEMKDNLIISDKDKAGLTLTAWKKDERAKNFKY